jgi:hypothetical protein
MGVKGSRADPIGHSKNFDFGLDAGGQPVTGFGQRRDGISPTLNRVNLSAMRMDCEDRNGH